MIITGVGQTEKEKLRRPIMNRKKKKKEKWKAGLRMAVVGTSVGPLGSSYSWKEAVQ